MQNLFASVAIAAAICSLAVQGQVLTNCSFSYKSKDDLGDERLSLEFGHYFVWGTTQSPDVSVRQNLTLEEAFFGSEIDIQFERVARDETCMIEECPFCKGKKYLRRKSTDGAGYFTQSIATPCPTCLGLGVTSIGGCSPYTSRRHIIRASFPAGTRPGYEISLPGYGNAVLKGLSFFPGDLKIVVDNVGQETDYSVGKSDVKLTVYLSPEEALNGFIFEKKYVDQMLRIDRTGKLTIPGAVARIAGGGFPVVSVNGTSSGINNTQQQEYRSGSDTSTIAAAPSDDSLYTAVTAIESTVPQIAYRDDLIITFELNDEEEDEEQEGKAAEEHSESIDKSSNSSSSSNSNICSPYGSTGNKSDIKCGSNSRDDDDSSLSESASSSNTPSGSGPIHISSQEDFDKYFGVNNAKRKSLMTRNMLLILKKKFAAVELN